MCVCVCVCVCVCLCMAAAAVLWQDVEELRMTAMKLMGARVERQKREREIDTCRGREVGV